MNRLLLILVGIALGIAAMKLIDSRWWETTVPSAEHDETLEEDDDDDAISRVERTPDAVRVTLSAAEIALAGIETGVLEAARAMPEEATAGRVAHSADLLALLADLRAARRTAAASRAVVSALASRVAQLRRLAAAGEITVARELATLEVEHRRELETAATREASVEHLETALRARWGTSIAALAETDSGPLRSMEEGAALIVEFVSAGAPPDTVHVAAGDDRRQAVAASSIGPGAAALGGAQGASWLALVPAGALRPGMPVTVWIPRTAAAVDGLVLPASAVVWHRGAQWYYVAEDATHFTRRGLVDALAYGRDYLLPAAQAPAAPVVLRGAQLLLAEEFRAAIPEEDDD